MAPSSEEFRAFGESLLSAALILLVVGVLLYAASGIWPSMVALESGSMQPEIERGDMVFVMEADRFPGQPHGSGGVVTAAMAADTGYHRFGGDGDVILFRPNGDTSQTPIVHRAMFWVEDGENWVDQANPAFLRGSTCADVKRCPAPNAGYITKGDNNEGYDQVLRLDSCKGKCDPVKPEWVIGTAEVNTPYLGELWLPPAEGDGNASGRD